MSDRSALLKSIEKGAKLKKTKQVNDRSAPQINNAKDSVTAATTAAASSVGNARGEERPTMPSVPMAGAGLFAGGFPKLRPTGKSLGGKEPESATPPPALPTRPKPQGNTSANAKHKNDAKSPSAVAQRKAPPPVPPRLATLSPTKPKPPTIVNQSPKANAPSQNGFLSQVKLRPVTTNNSEKRNDAPMQHKESFANNKESKTANEPAPIARNASNDLVMKKLVVQKEAESSTQKEDFSHDLPPVPRGFSGRAKEYPSGASSGLWTLEQEYNAQAQIEALEKELKEAALREDFEVCVELKKKLSQLKLLK